MNNQIRYRSQRTAISELDWANDIAGRLELLSSVCAKKFVVVGYRRRVISEIMLVLLLMLLLMLPMLGGHHRYHDNDGLLLGSRHLLHSLVLMLFFVPHMKDVVSRPCSVPEENGQ